jgi:alpha-maltose-1-phosphate synthase
MNIHDDRTPPSRPLRVGVSTPSRFHAVDLAEQLDRQGYLSGLYTALPRRKVPAALHDLASTFPMTLGPAWFMSRILGERNRPLVRAGIAAFDARVASGLRQCDVFHCMSGFGLASHRAAKNRYGALTVCDRGSAHIQYQNEVLAEEHREWNIPYRPIDPVIVDREMAEYEACDVISVPSTFAYQSFVQKGIASAKLARISYGVDLSMFLPLPKRDRRFRAIFVGNASLQKGLPYLLEAVRDLNLSGFELWLVGAISPEMKPLMERYSTVYRHFGVVPRSRLSELYSQASVLVLPSVQEGLALVQAQAMACGLPVIATPHTGATDILNDGIEGFIVPIRSASAIRDKLRALYESPELLARMGAAALRRARAMGGWTNYGEEMVEMYEQRRGLSIGPCLPLTAHGIHLTAAKGRRAS